MIATEPTIIAQCTPQGPGALALLRISGYQARAIATHISKLADATKSLKDVPSHTVHYGWIVDGVGKHIDQVLFIVMQGPRTFTGEDVVEITCHNNPLIIESIIEQAIVAGARMAQEGEFSRRAYMNGKMDLLQAEAVHELIHASTQMALKQALSQLEGSLSSWITSLEKDLMTSLAFCQASFEFIDEELEFGTTIRDQLSTVLQKIIHIKNSFGHQQHIRQGVRVALLGSVNAGKSSLFNALIQKNRAIVSDTAGTTRDSIEATITYQDTTLTFIDTAGLRQTEDHIEQDGIKRSWQEAELADVIVWVYDGSQLLSTAQQEIAAQLQQRFGNKIIVVRNKADLPIVHTSAGSIPVSYLLPDTLDALKIKLTHKMNDLFAQLDSPFLLTKRQYALLLSLEQKLGGLLALMQSAYEYEIIAYHLQDALELVTELSGKTISEQSMDAVFREFCVGK